MNLKHVITIFLLSLSCMWAKSQTYPQVIIPGDYPDPTVLKDGEDYYMTHSPFYYQPGFLIWHSRDLMNWTPVCRAMGEWKGSAMAPDLQKVGDTYYIYYPAAGTNWVITAKDIRGPWSEPMDLKIGGIDPGLVVTPEGKRFLFTSAGQVTPLTDDGLSRAGRTETVYEGWQYPREWETECMCLESPKLNYRDGWYYMTSAEGGTAGPATSHMVVAARSRSIYGPWKNSPYNPIVHTYSADEQWWSKGHGSLVEGPDRQWWVIYHAYQNGAYALGRQTLIEPVEWTANGWYRPVKDLPVERLPRLDFALSDDFSSSAIGWQWMGWKENITRVAEVKKGKLMLPARGTSPRDGRVMLTTAMHTAYAVEATLNIGKGNEGGLLLYYNENAYAGLVADGKTFTIYTDSATCETFPNHLGKRFVARIENNGGRMTVMVSDEGKEWTVLKRDIDVSLLHHNNYHGFYALRPALYSAKGEVCVFDDFKYISTLHIDGQIKESLAYCHRQIGRSLSELGNRVSGIDYTLMPRNIADTATVWHLRKAAKEEWCAGFWPGVLWYDYEHSNDPAIRKEAEKFTASLEFLSRTPAFDHDLGFLVFCSYGNGYRLTGNPAYKQVILDTADTLATLFNPTVGALLSWPRHVKDYGGHNVIMDNMMNLEMLFWAAKNGGRKELYDIAVAHADKTMKNHFRPDYTSYHVAVYDTLTGERINALTHQGYADESLWARGQAWAIYGFTMAYRETGDTRYLDFVQRVTDTYLQRLPEDAIPYWDFDDPRIPDAPRDASAACVVASALAELHAYVPTEKGTYYKEMALKMLQSLGSDTYRAGEAKPSFLLHSTGNLPAGSEIDASIIYADYYYVEALLKWKNVLDKNM